MKKDVTGELSKGISCLISLIVSVMRLSWCMRREEWILLLILLVLTSRGFNTIFSNIFIGKLKKYRLEKEIMSGLKTELLASKLYNQQQSDQFPPLTGISFKAAWGLWTTRLYKKLKETKVFWQGGSKIFLFFLRNANLATLVFK